jgi:hypothetical protein
MNYFIGFCVNNLENDGSPQQPVKISLRNVGNDTEAKLVFDEFKRKHGADYEGLPYAERPRLIQQRIVAE